MRLFTAILLPGPVLEGLSQAMEACRAAGVRGSFTRRENLHLTLVFLGETCRLEDAREILASAGRQASAFPLEISGLGVFRRRGGDILWAGVRKSEALAALQSRLAKEFSQAGFPLEDRPYSPHLTLARQVKNLPPEALARLEGALPPLTMTAHRVSLMESCQVAGKLAYAERGGQDLRR